MIKNHLFAILIIVIAFVAGLALNKTGFLSRLDNNSLASPAAVKVGDKSLDFSMFDRQGKLRQLSEWYGNIIILNFWATWCPPCLKEVPMLSGLATKYKLQGVKVIGVALQEREELGTYVQETKINYPILVGTIAAMQVSKLYNNELGALPYTVIIAPNREIVFQQRGLLLEANVEQIILELLKQN